MTMTLKTIQMNHINRDNNTPNNQSDKPLNSIEAQASQQVIYERQQRPLPELSHANCELVQLSSNRHALWQCLPCDDSTKESAILSKEDASIAQQVDEIMNNIT